MVGEGARERLGGPLREARIVRVGAADTPATALTAAVGLTDTRGLTEKDADPVAVLVVSGEGDVERVVLINADTERPVVADTVFDCVLLVLGDAVNEPDLLPLPEKEAEYDGL